MFQLVTLGHTPRCTCLHRKLLIYQCRELTSLLTRRGDVGVGSAVGPLTVIFFTVLALVSGRSSSSCSSELSSGDRHASISSYRRERHRVYLRAQMCLHKRLRDVGVLRAAQWTDDEGRRDDDEGGCIDIEHDVRSN